MATYRIEDDAADLPGRYEMEPRDLCRRTGFGGGVMLWEVREWLMGHDHLVVDPHELLAAVVEDLLLPRLDPEPLVEHIGGLHNPVRAVSAEGDLLRRSQAPESWPEVVMVRRGDVLDIARELADPADHADDSGSTEWADRWDFDAA